MAVGSGQKDSRFARAERTLGVSGAGRGPADEHGLDRRLLAAASRRDDVRLHDLSHTHASIALRQGETVLAIGKLLGHADTATTLEYTHPADAAAMEAAETVGAILGN